MCGSVGFDLCQQEWIMRKSLSILYLVGLLALVAGCDEAKPGQGLVVMASEPEEFIVVEGPASFADGRTAYSVYAARNPNDAKLLFPSAKEPLKRGEKVRASRYTFSFDGGLKDIVVQITK